MSIDTRFIDMMSAARSFSQLSSRKRQVVQLARPRGGDEGQVVRLASTG